MRQMCSVAHTVGEWVIGTSTEAHAATRFQKSPSAERMACAE
jgi:hypothetical protein